MEVIIVDDCSDTPHQKALKELQCKYPFYCFTTTETRAGGGQARNVGIELARGEFLLFADSDDYFLPGINDILDKLNPIEADVDIVFFNVISLDSSTGEFCDRWKHIDTYFQAYHKQNELPLRYIFGEPWGKIIRKQLITDYHIRFDALPINNDTTFSYLAGHYAKAIRVHQARAYCLTYHPQSVSNTISWERLAIRLEVFSRKHLFLKNHQIKLFDYMLITPFWDCIKKRSLSHFRAFLRITDSFHIKRSLIYTRLLLFICFLVKNKITCR